MSLRVIKERGAGQSEVGGEEGQLVCAACTAMILLVCD
jgi:hypothetical protein